MMGRQTPSPPESGFAAFHKDPGHHAKSPVNTGLFAFRLLFFLLTDECLRRMSAQETAFAEHQVFWAEGHPLFAPGAGVQAWQAVPHT